MCSALEVENRSESVLTDWCSGGSALVESYVKEGEERWLWPRLKRGSGGSSRYAVLPEVTIEIYVITS